LSNRVTLVPGDFLVDQLPSGHDLAFVSAIIHQNSHKENLFLYKNIFGALNSGGRIVIRDHIMESDRTSPRDGAVFAVNMLMATEGGNTYTFEEISEGLAETGFVRVRLLQSGAHMDGLVEAYKP
jgi:3-hydroxy-5-methyl-1-naphthoate 3-O-methyltransferase